MGEVYRARDAQLRREIAIKVLPAEFSSNPDRRRRFEQEARAAGGLNHPNILAVHDAGLHDQTPYIVTELLEGETLRARLLGRPLAVRKSAEYAVQIASGLAAGHERGIVHRDIKPDNLFVTTSGLIKILDFGLAKLLNQESGEDTDTMTMDGEHRTPVVGGGSYNDAPLLEPGRFRAPRDAREREHAAPGAVIERCYPAAVAARVFLTHTRPESVLGALGPLHTGPATVGLGFVNLGGTLSIEGLLFLNRASWAHTLAAAARLLGLPRERLLDEPECAALDGRVSPHGVIVPALAA
jgi:serine/threonine protein kinase